MLQRSGADIAALIGHKLTNGVSCVSGCLKANSLVLLAVMIRLILPTSPLADAASSV